LQAGIRLEHGLEVRPIDFVHLTKGIQIDGDDFGRVFCQHGLDGSLFSYAGMPWDEAERNMRLFARKVMPELKRVGADAEPAAEAVAR